MKKTILALSIVMISNAAFAESYYFRTPINGMSGFNVITGDNSGGGSGVDEEIVLEEGDDSLCRDVSSDYYLYKYELVSGDVDAYYIAVIDNEEDPTVYSKSSNHDIYYIESKNIDAEILIGTLPNSVRSIVYEPASEMDFGDFVLSLSPADSFEYCGDDMDNMIITYGAGGVEDPEPTTDFQSYSFTSPYFSKKDFGTQCAVDFTTVVNQSDVKVEVSETDGFSNTHYKVTDSNGEATVEAVSVHTSLSATLDNGNVQGVPAYIDDHSVPSEVRGTYFDENNYYAVLRDDEDNIVSNHAVIDGHTETIYNYEVGNYVDRVTAPDDYPNADRMDRHEIILVGDCLESGGGDEIILM